MNRRKISLKLSTLLIIVFFSTLICSAIAHEVTKYKYFPKPENFPLPNGVLLDPITFDLTSLIDTNNLDKSNIPEMLDLEAEILISYENLNKGLIYVKITKIPAELVRICVFPIQYDIVPEFVRLYKDGYYPLNYGSNDYTLKIFLKGTDDLFYEAYKMDFEAEFETNEPYKYSNVYSDYTHTSVLAAKAYELTYNLSTTEEKANKIANYLSNNITYDSLHGVKEEVPDVDLYFERRRGVCYHYSALFSSMMKSIGIPTKEVRGYGTTSSDYHSWNEYLSEDSNWITIDCTPKANKNDEYTKEDHSDR